MVEETAHFIIASKQKKRGGARVPNASHDLKLPIRLCVLKLSPSPSGVKLDTKPLTHGPLGTFKIQAKKENTSP